MKVFLSHTSSDKDLVGLVHQKLEKKMYGMMQPILKMGKVFQKKLMKDYVMQRTIYFFGVKRHAYQSGYVLN